MRTVLTTAMLGLLIAAPMTAQAQNVQQLLGGLLTGNQGQDQALREAYQRGYQHGREDQAREDRHDRRRPEDRGDYRNQPPPEQSYQQPGYPARPGYPPYDPNR